MLQIPNKEQVDSLAQELRRRAKIPGSFSFEVIDWYLQVITLHSNSPSRMSWFGFVLLSVVGSI